MKLINGLDIARSTLHQVAQEIGKIEGRKPGLAFLRIGEDPASKVYVSIKKKKCAEVGIVSFDWEMPASSSQEEILKLLTSLNQDPLIDGILLQLPLPSHLEPYSLIESISPLKDVDGFHPYNMGKLLLGEAGGFVPCTPEGIHRLLINSKIDISGKHVVIVGRSNIVGKPLAALLMQKQASCNATVTVAHSSSQGLTKICQEADILIAAVGKPHCISKEMIKRGAVVIDVGINKRQTSEGTILTGDVEFAEVAPLCSYITPVPGGVGPMTVAILMENTLKAYKLSKG